MDTNIPVVHKKRGRPKKIISQKSINDLQIEHELILCYPIIYNENINDISETDNNNTIDTTINTLTDSIIVDDKEDIINIKCNNISLHCPFANINNIIINTDYTDICCMHDCCKIKGKPYFLPDKLVNNTFYIIGWFCSLNCAMAYNLNMKDENINQRTNLLYYLYNVEDNILPAPSILLLKKFGGNYTIDEYRKLNKNNDNYIILNDTTLYCNTTFSEYYK